MRVHVVIIAIAAILVVPMALAEDPLAALECDPVDEWVAAGDPPTVRSLANHHGWSAFEAVRGKERRYFVAHPPDDGESTLPPWGNIDAPAEGACYAFKTSSRVKVPKAGSFGPKGGTHTVRVMVDERCSDESCAYLLLGLDAKGTATSAVVLTADIARLERLSVFGDHDSLLVTAHSGAGAGFRHVMTALIHDSGAGLAPLLAAEIGVHEELAPSERAENRDLRCWRQPAGWLRVEKSGAAPVVDILEPDLESENGEGLGTGRRGRWAWSTVKKAFERVAVEKFPYDARAPCRK